jgi:hypothetical protein
MTYRSFAATTSRKRVALAMLVSASLSLGAPFVATSSADPAHAAGTPVSAGFGDCKNDNGGLHLGYVCPTPAGGGGTGGVINV